MRPGIYDNISNADYHGGPGVSKSILDLIARSPLHAHARLNAANDNEPTAAQAIGTAFHTLVLEPEVFAKEYCLALRPQDVPEAVADKDVLLAKVAELNAGRKAKLSTSGTKDELVARIVDAEAGETVGVKTPAELDAMKGTELKEYINHLNASRAGLLPTSGTMEALALLLRDAGHPVTLWSDVKAEWMANNGHRKVLSQDAWDQIHGMREALMAHPAACAALTGGTGVAERSVYWTDEATGELCRCRPDWWRLDIGVIVDLKTTEDASPEGFAKSIAGWRYDVQHPFYLDGVNTMRRQYKPAELDLPMPKEVRAFIFVAVEKKFPYAVGVYALDSDSVDVGRALIRRDLATWAECRQRDVWPGYGDAVQTITLPQWHKVKHAQLLDDAA